MNIGNSNSKKYYVGAALLQPLFFCPKRKQLNELLGTEKEEEIEYVNVVKINNGNEEIETERASLTLWVKEVKNNLIFPIVFNVYNVNNVSKAGNQQFVNQFGKASWVDVEENLKNEFKKHKKGFEIRYVPCLKGMEDVYKFFRALITDSHVYFGGNQQEDILFDTSKFFEENFSQLNDLLEQINRNKVFTIAGVDDIITDEGRKTYQKFLTKAFLPGRLFSLYSSQIENNFENVFDFHEKKVLATQGDKMSIGYFLKTATDEQTWQSFRKYFLLEEYNENENPAINEGVAEAPWFEQQ